MYDVELTNEAQKFLRKLDKHEQEKILKKIYCIKENPISFLKKLSANHYWRLRIDDYRAIVDVVIIRQKIIVLRIGHRKNMYGS